MAKTETSLIELKDYEGKYNVLFPQSKYSIVGGAIQQLAAPPATGEPSHKQAGSGDDLRRLGGGAAKPKRRF